MAVGLIDLQRTQFGLETVLGTEVNATTYFRGQNENQDDQEIVYPEEHVGILGGAGRTYSARDETIIELPEIEATFEQLPYLGSWGIKSAVAGVQDGAGTDYIYTYPFPTGWQVPDSYTLEVGDNIQAEVITACFAESFKISGKANEAWKMGSTLRGWSPADETAPGTFTGALTIPTVYEVLFGFTSLYIDAIGGTAGTTQITSSFLNFSLEVSNIYRGVATGDGSGKHFIFLKPAAEGGEIKLTFTLEHDTQSVQEREYRRLRTARLIQIKGESEADVTTPGTTYSKKTVLITLPGTYMEADSYGDEEGNRTIEFSFKGHYHATPANRGSLVVVNELNALA